MTQSQQVANTILHQLGGRRFLAMTGSKNLMTLSEGNGLVMQLTRNAAKAKWMRIRLNGSDLYDVEFIKQDRKTSEPVNVAEINDIYAENLQETFTAVTGLYTSL